jgi:hypothetical protein
MLGENVCGDADRDYGMKCAWCGRVIERSNVRDSHGMCEECYRRELEGQRVTDGPNAGGDFEQGGRVSNKGGK